MNGYTVAPSNSAVEAVPNESDASEPDMNRARLSSMTELLLCVLESGTMASWVTSVEPEKAVSEYGISLMIEEKSRWTY